MDSVSKALLITILLLGALSTNVAFSQDLQVFACDDCSFSEAKQIASQNAPDNACESDGFGGGPNFCPPVSQNIIVAKFSNSSAWKFEVITNKDSNGQEFYQVYELAPSPEESDLIQDFFTLYNDFDLSAATVSHYDYSNAMESPESYPMNDVANVDGMETCDSPHPTDYFRNVNTRSTMKTDLAGAIEQHMAGQTSVEYQSEALPNGGGFSIGKGSIGASVSLQYSERKIIVTKWYNGQNYLAFNVFLKAQFDPGSQKYLAKVALGLSKIHSKIDGIQADELLGDTGSSYISDTEGAELSPCTIEYIRKKGEKVEDTSSPSGSGTKEDPFVGGSNHPSWAICRETYAVQTCSTPAEGQQTCTNANITFLTACSAMNN